MPQDDKTACKLSAVENAQAIHGSNGQLISRKPGALLLVAAAYVLGGGGMLAWLAFLLLGPLVPLDVELGIAGGLMLDTFLCLLFFIQHSIMVRRGFRLWLTRTVRADFHGAFYAAASGTVLLLLTGLWQPVGSALWTPPGPVRWAMIMVFLAAGAGAWWGSRSLGDFDALGVKPALQTFGSRKPITATPFIVRGPYRWVRHPLYLFSLIIIWSCPIFTVDRLLHNGLWTLWIIVGATMEERDLVACFGQDYRSYQKTVPMLLPTSFKPLMQNLNKNARDHF
ncbi:MAG: isoprenylcysteine carboxylmethyltransferase family protein [Desulfosarcina sp.]|nr:isoprenylcysteine carboxylmethyltransferase family protein [Desulfosarcina sp.]